jgi:hypothetical protein
VFRTLGQFALGVLDLLPEGVEARFEPGTGGVLAVDMVRMDTVVRLRHPSLAGADATFGASSFFLAYLPTSLCLALFAVTPRAWRSSRWPFVAALVLLHFFFVLRLVVAAYYTCSKCNVDGRPLVALGAGGMRALFLGWHLVWEEAFTNYLLPILVWATCVFGTRSRVEAGP